MKRISVYLKLRVLGAIDSMAGNSMRSRIQEVAKLTFHDEDGVPHVFTWRTIQTWLSIYRQGGVEMLRNRPRSDKGKLSPLPFAASFLRCRRSPSPVAFAVDFSEESPARPSSRRQAYPVSDTLSKGRGSAKATAKATKKVGFGGRPRKRRRQRRRCAEWWRRQRILGEGGLLGIDELVEAVVVPVPAMLPAHHAGGAAADTTQPI